jgi:hypothetical protein
MLRDPAEHLLRGLHDDAVRAHEIARAKYRESVFGERRRHVRTVRSVAQWRNRPRSGLAWLILFVAVALLAFSIRLAAADPAIEPSAESGVRSDDVGVTPSASELAEQAAFDLDWSDADAADAREESLAREPTRIGRIDLTVTWRRTVREREMRAVDAIVSALEPVTSARGVLWVLVTWTR